MTRWERQWKLALKCLRESAPLSKPTLVRRTKRKMIEKSASMWEDEEPERHMGSASLLAGRFVIYISSLEAHNTQLDTLLHEWAHCLAYPAQRRAKTTWTHDDIFGVAYAHVYRLFYQEPTP